MNIESMSIKEIQKGYMNQSFTVKEITCAYLSKIKKWDKKIQAMITLCEDDAIKKATLIDGKIQKNEDIGPLGGIPMVIKDNICTKGIYTTCASRMLKDFIPSYDATVISKIKENQGIILGKTNMDEFSMGSSTEHSAIQITKNPWDTNKVPGGSSGGSAAAVCAGFAPVGIGSDTGGSIRQPASFCGLVGMKPTYGAISRYGLIAFASSLDQIGILSKNVEDCRHTFNVLKGKDFLDATTKDIDDIEEESIHGVKEKFRIGVAKEFFKEGLEEDAYNAIEYSIKRLEKMGHYVQNFSISMPKSSLSAYYTISSAEASSNLARYDGIRYGYRPKKFDSIDELMIKARTQGFGDEVKRRILLGTYALSEGYYHEYYQKAMGIREKIQKEFEEIFKKYDVLVLPTTPSVAFDIGKKINDPLKMYLSDIYTVYANLAGLPAISIPCGFSKGLPVGIQFIGNAFEESRLLKIAEQLQRDLQLQAGIKRLKEDIK